MSKPEDWIAIIEAGYDLSGTDTEWLARIAASSGPAMRRGLPVLAFQFRCTPSRFEIGSTGVCGPSILAHWARGIHSIARPESITRIYRSGSTVGCLSEQVYRDFPEQRSDVLRATGGVVRDVIGLTGYTGLNSGISVGMALPVASPPRPIERRRWPLIASHLAAAMRLRSAVRLWAAGDTADVAQGNTQAEAVLSPDGRLLHGSPAVQGADIRAALREAVRRIDGARTRRGRDDADAALGAWTALVSGRWSLVDRFDADGRRFVVALRNDPRHADPRGLSERECQVATLVGLGRSLKEITYELGLSTTAVAGHAAAAQCKLGLNSRTELAAFFSPGGVRARLAEVALGGEHLLVGSCPLIDPSCVEGLSAAEREVSALLLSGSTLADIAQRRGASANTIANQVQALYRKVGVRSRIELAAAMQGRAAELGMSN